MIRILLPFSDRASGERAVRYLLSAPPKVPFEVELLAVAEPLTPGKVRIFLGRRQAEAMVKSAAAQWIEEVGKLLEAANVRYSATAVTGRRADILRRSVRRADVDSVYLPAAGPRWLVSALGKWRADRLARATGHSITIVP